MSKRLFIAARIKILKTKETEWTRYHFRKDCNGVFIMKVIEIRLHQMCTDMSVDYSVMNALAYEHDIREYNSRLRHLTFNCCDSCVEVRICHISENREKSAAWGRFHAQQPNLFYTRQPCLCNVSGSLRVENCTIAASQVKQMSADPFHPLSVAISLSRPNFNIVGISVSTTHLCNLQIR